MSFWKGFEKQARKKSISIEELFAVEPEEKDEYKEMADPVEVSNGPPTLFNQYPSVLNTYAGQG